MDVGRRALVLALTGACLVIGASQAQGQPARLYQADSRAPSHHPVDVLVEARLKERGLEPAPLCSDEVFLRRIYLDVTGTLPSRAEQESFRTDAGPDRRGRVVDQLLSRDEFADYWSLKWCDLLRVKSEFPINLWPRAVHAYHRWVRTAIQENRAYDRFARELLTASGSAFRFPAVNFYRAVQNRGPESTALAVALTFMGTRASRWPAASRAGMAAFFSRISFKTTSEWKEEIVMPDPAAVGPLAAVYPDGVAVQIAPGVDPRTVFADWLVAPTNPWFSRALVNRIWAWLLGRGIIHEPDDIRPDNPPSNPALLAYLERELVSHRFDAKHIFRLVLTSRTYQRSSLVESPRPEAEALFASYPVRRLDAEVLIDAISRITGNGETYQSAIPEPFTFIPEYQSSVTLADGSISSPFLEMFGRPSRDTGLEAERRSELSDEQILHLQNSTHVQRKITRSSRLEKLAKSVRLDPAALTELLYLEILSRQPTPDELAAAIAYIKAGRWKPRPAVEDLIWALLNTKEFLYRH